MPSKNRSSATTKIDTDGDAAAPETAASKLRAALVAAPGSTAVGLAVSIGINKSTAGKILARWEADGTAVRTTRGVVDGRRAGDLWSAVAADVLAAPDVVEPEAAEPDEVVPDPVTEPEVAEIAVPAREPFGPLPGGRLKPGALRDMTETFLRVHPGESFGPTHIGRALGRSQGAVNNALEALTSAGTVVKTQEAPKRFAIAPTAVN
ncbi:hypothetical protein AB0A63_00100 [Lentzea sp. NPDC042327]|uniref:hypothetical protein n=1 Tax=Lentzea sp. NPDC042327 TaxID=3154801 RepID=UPI0033C9B80D